MSSSTKASIAATATALLVITTPFVQPEDCRTQWKTASVSYSFYRGTTLTSLLMASEPASSCYPSGWNDVVPESRLSFSPGVCPDGWTYNQMGENGSAKATTAFCCNGNFTYESSAVETGVRHRCRRWGWNTGTGADPFPLTPTNQVTMVHQPWAVTWAASDTATLTPQLPNITSSMTVPIWTPGQTIPDGIWDDKGQDNGVQIDGGFLAVIITLPIIGFLVTCCLIWCCARACYKKRKERRIVYIVDGTIPPTAHAVDTQTQNQ